MAAACNIALRAHEFQDPKPSTLDFGPQQAQSIVTFYKQGRCKLCQGGGVPTGLGSACPLGPSSDGHSSTRSRAPGTGGPGSPAPLPTAALRAAVPRPLPFLLGPLDASASGSESPDAESFSIGPSHESRCKPYEAQSLGLFRGCISCVVAGCRDTLDNHELCLEEQASLVLLWFLQVPN